MSFKKLDKRTKKDLLRGKKEKKRCLKQYPDWKDDEHNCGPLKFIWGIKSHDDLTSCEANFYSMNDIDICYNRDTQKYLLGLETIYKFDTTKAKISYLDNLCNLFYNHLKGNFDSTIDPFYLYMYNDGNLFQADSETELYYKFKVFTEGFKRL